ncbi:MAG: HK97-gp10 family putative phage morphogenesis protein [Beijerinckiaceae bacterium]
MSVDGLKELNRKFARMPEEVRRDLAKELDRSAHDVAGLARGLAPRDEGDLVQSIGVEPGKHDLARNVVAGDDDAYYARWVEHGSDKTRASPFFFPAYRALRRAIRARLGRAYAKAAKRVARQSGGT